MSNGISTPNGFQLPKAISFEEEDERRTSLPIRSSLSQSESLECAQLVELVDGEGTILYYPRDLNIEVGDVFFLRERLNEGQIEDGQVENGIIVQMISLGIASYPQADTKALFRLMVRVRASILERSHNEPSEVIDEFLLAKFKIRASITNGKWNPPSGKVVTRNVDIFWLDPSILALQIFEEVDGLNINLGDYKEAPVAFFGGGFEKINLITGMKGGGKSHIAKGIISESLGSRMSAIVFDINNEYRGLPNSFAFIPGQDLRFRLDRIKAKTFFEMIDRLAPFAERTSQVARAKLPDIIRARIDDDKTVPDLEFLCSQVANVIMTRGEPGTNMRASYESTFRVLGSYNLIMTEAQARAEDEFIRGKAESPKVVSLSSVLYNIEHGNAGIIIFDIGGLSQLVQYVVVDLILDTLKEICHRQTEAYKKGSIKVPNYPTIYFEEAHMYMEPKVIDELLPLIRHHGMNVFFITNTPGALPDSVFRLMDNLVMTRMLNRQDIDQVKNCGLTDSETIEGFASNLREYHALLLSSLGGATNNFPLVFHVRDFGLPKSGETRSMWNALRNKALKESTDS